jgi:hypothetical protein
MLVEAVVAYRQALIEVFRKAADPQHFPGLLEARDICRASRPMAGSSATRSAASFLVADLLHCVGEELADSSHFSGDGLLER